MFEVFRLRFFVAKVQAELKAQHNDQKFVNEICQLPSNIEAINELKKYAYYRNEKIAPFLVVCHILGESLDASELGVETKNICGSLLAERLQKISTDRHFQLKHCFIFSELERKVQHWVETINT